MTQNPWSLRNLRPTKIKCYTCILSFPCSHKKLVSKTSLGWSGKTQPPYLYPQGLGWGGHQERGRGGALGLPPFLGCSSRCGKRGLVPGPDQFPSSAAKRQADKWRFLSLIMRAGWTNGNMHVQVQLFVLMAYQWQNTHATSEKNTAVGSNHNPRLGIKALLGSDAGESGTLESPPPRPMKWIVADSTHDNGCNEQS